MCTGGQQSPLAIGLFSLEGSHPPSVTPVYITTTASFTGMFGEKRRDIKTCQDFVILQLYSSHFLCMMLCVADEEGQEQSWCLDSWYDGDPMLAAVGLMACVPWGGHRFLGAGTLMVSVCCTGLWGTCPSSSTPIAWSLSSSPVLLLGPL